MNLSEQDKMYMRRALELAEKARGRTSPNPMVGAVLVQDGRVVGEGYHQKAGTPHAEIHALSQAGERARGATLYVTLEPCCHHGRTGPCTSAVLAAGVRRVVVAMTDPNPLVAGKGLAILQQHGVEVVSGVLEAEARRLNEIFIKYITTRRPFVLLKAAMSLDGKIATATGQSQWITGEAARLYGHRYRDWYDAICVGVNTVLADDPMLTARLPEGPGKNPLRVILDSRGRTPSSARVLATARQVPTLLATTEQTPPEVRQSWQDCGAQVLVLPGDGGRVSLPALLDELGRREISSLLVEGGAAVHAAFLQQGLADKLLWFIAPKIIGGHKAPGPVGDPGVAELARAWSVRQWQIKQLGEDLCIEGYLARREE